MRTESFGGTSIAQQISVIREFNRFYTARLGLLRRRHLDGEFSFTEARTMYEIGSSLKITASTLCGSLQLDAGYMSRILSSLTRRKLVRQIASVSDGREKLLSLTAAGETAVRRLNEQSDSQIRDILAGMNTSQREWMVASLAKVRSMLASQNAPVEIVRLTDLPKEALAILDEYYEAVHVVQRDRPGSIQKLLHARGSGMWLAYLKAEVVGCVVLRRLESIPRASECKRLYVKPGARGRRIAGKLLDAMEAFAREQRIEWIYLDTYDDLKTAISLYERRGYKRCERYNDNPQATLFMRKRLIDRGSSISKKTR